LKVGLESARDDSDVRVVIITGAGPKAFCAGADITELPKLTTADQLGRHGRPSPIHMIRDIPKPVIAMVNGLALGGGCEIVLACDMAIASENAKFGLPEIKVGVIPGSGGTQVLPRLIGEKRARELIYTGNFITAAEALQMGMINRVVPPDKLKSATEEFIAPLLKRSPVLLQIAKLAVNRSLETSLSAGLASERDLYAAAFGTLDQKEGARAFLEKREPNYQGK
ncbi:MAG: enoyl-CoA hydratase/isomerase family protein, partial [Kiritimatiellota bacterium]|nr:enoyl-CoA hydratase/isomerase family protein [Kiritimatiellota bacterium]